jgi:hypothetical protein
MTWSSPKRRLLDDVSVSDILRDHWIRCMEDLDCIAIKDHLWAQRFITDDDFDKIRPACTTRRIANDVVMNRLRESATGLKLLSFAHLPQTHDPLTYSKHLKIGREIECSLDRFVGEGPVSP